MLEFEPAQLPLAGRADITRILIMKWSAMGDVTLASAAIDDIRRAFPDAEIDLDTLPPWHRLYADDPRFHTVHAYALRARGLLAQARAMVAWLRAVRARRYDLVFDLQTTDRSRLMLGLLWATGAQIRYRAGNKPAWPYNLAPAKSASAQHALDLARSTLACAGVASHADRPILFISPAYTERAAQLMQAHGVVADHFAVFLPGCQAAGYLKRWGANHYADLATRLLDNEVAHVVILGGPDEIDECAVITSLAADPRVINLCGQTHLLEVPAIANHARVIVGNDTGTAHLAAASGRPMVIACGPTDPRRVLPAGPDVHGVQLDIPCANCYAKHCAHHSCMRLLDPAQVEQAVTAAIAQQARAT